MEDDNFNFSFDRHFDKFEPFERKLQGIERSKRMKVLTKKDPDMKFYVLITISLIVLGMLLDNDIILHLKKIF